MKDNTILGKYCQDIEKLAYNDSISWKKAYFMMKEYLFKYDEILDRLFLAMDKKIDTQTEFGEITPETIKREECEVL